MRARVVLPALVVVVIAALGHPAVALADDTSPPIGTLEIEEGRGYTDDGTLILDVPATDDIGVVTVRVHLVGGEWTDFPYAPRIEWTFGDVSQISEQQLRVEVQWRDAAGNASTAQKTIWYDATPPDLQIFKETTSYPGPPGTITFYVGAYEEGSGVAAVRFSTDNGANWGSAIAMTDQIVFWDPRDAAFGGKPKGLGPVTVLAKVRDGAGLWSNVRSTTVEYTASVHIAVSPDPATGQPVTFTPEWSTPVALPKGTHCMWEFMTGDDQAIFAAEHNESFTYNMTQGPAGGGWCGSWTFTLPWSPVRQYLVAFRVMLPGGSSIDAELGAPGKSAFRSTVGSTSRAIQRSNLPMFYVLPDDYELTVGMPATYRGYALGGATIKSSDRWIVIQNGLTSYPGADSFTYTPQKAGHVTVCLQRQPGSTPMDQLGACFDPPVRRAAGGTVVATAPPATATDAAPTEPVASIGPRTPTPGAVAVAPTDPPATAGPPAAPNEGPSSGPAASAGSAPPGPLWGALLLGAIGFVVGLTLLLRPTLRAALRSRVGRAR